MVEPAFVSPRSSVRVAAYAAWDAIARCMALAPPPASKPAAAAGDGGQERSGAAGGGQLQSPKRLVVLMKARMTGPAPRCFLAGLWLVN